MKPVVLSWRVTCFACGRVITETTSYKRANGIWIQHKNAHAGLGKVIRPQLELIRIEGEGPGVDHDEEARR